MRKTLKNISLKYYILVPLIIILILQFTIFSGALIFSGAHDSLSDSLNRVLESTVSAKGDTLENQFSSYTNINEFYTKVTDTVSSKASSLDMDVSSFISQKNNRYDVLYDIVPVVRSYLKKSGASSCYIILENKSYDSLKDAIYIRNVGLDSLEEDDSDIVALAGDPLILNRYGIPRAESWTRCVDTHKNCTFYQTAYKGGNSYRNVQVMDLGYISQPINVHDGETMCITYSVPLLDSNHHSYGVIGFDITFDSLEEMLSSANLVGDDNSCYMIGTTSDYTTINNMYTASDSDIYKEIATGTSINITPSNETYKIYNIAFTGLTQKTSACVYPLRLYSSRSPYYDENWVIAGLVNTKSLNASTQKLEIVTAVAMILALLLSFAGILIIIHFVMKPIDTLNSGIPKLAPGYTSLPKTNISEFDNLSNAIEKQNVSIYNLGNKMSDIIDISEISLGVCELDPDYDVVYCTHQIFDIFEISDSGWDHNRIKQKLLMPRLTFIEPYFEQSHENPNIYKFQNSSSAVKWLEIKKNINGRNTLLIVSDITEEVLEKQKIIHDRDYDILTGLYNRGAFIREVKYLIDGKHCNNGIISVWDLDNLKYTNDTYGHDTGDKYICKLADLIRQELPEKNISARLAGDEFTIFLYDEPEDVILKAMTNLHNNLMKTKLSLPDGKELNMSASAGFACYNTDADNYAELLKYADFAMYQVKKNAKGSIRQFNRDSYMKDYLLVQGVGELDRIIANEAIRYAYQPIISVDTGEIFAYEALIRPVSDLLGRPDNLIRVSMAQAKLDKIERITWFHSLAGFFNQVHENDNARIFINSIPNQLISDDDWKELENMYGEKLSRIVMEITEETQSEADMEERKRSFCQKWNIPIALDDYGSGYSNSDILVSNRFHFVKLDMSLIRNIDKAKSTQSLVHGIIEYCHDNLLKVIAEGIETEEEFKTVKELGADFVQGFLLAKPSYSLY
jgi:diguanylate cyclase (GGDEF)-like protein